MGLIAERIREFLEENNLKKDYFLGRPFGTTKEFYPTVRTSPEGIESFEKFRKGAKGLTEAVMEFPERPIREFLEKKGVSPLKAGLTGLAIGLATPLPGGKLPKFKGFKDLTTKFLEYAKGKTILSRQEIMDFARRPELKKGEADLLNRLGSELKDAKIPAQEVADSIRRDLLELKPVKVKEPQFSGTTLREPALAGSTRKGPGENYEEVVFESPITTNGSSHYPNSKNYFAHARGDEVVEGGKRIWREQEIQSDLLQKDNLESLLKGWDRRAMGLTSEDRSEYVSLRRIEEQGRLNSQEKNKLNELNKKLELIKEEDLIKNKQREIEMARLQPFTNDRFGERIMRERIKEKAQKGYSKYRLPTGETIGKIEGFEMREWITPKGLVIEPRDLKVGIEIIENMPHETGSSWIITDILGDGRFKAVPKTHYERWNRPVEQIGQKMSGGREFVDLPRSEQLEIQKSQIEGFKETFNLTGGNAQYIRYEKWGKFLQNKYGGKRITDPQGNTWMEARIVPEMARMPIEAFGITPLLLTEEKENK